VRAANIDIIGSRKAAWCARGARSASPLTHPPIIRPPHGRVWRRLECLFSKVSKMEQRRDGCDFTIAPSQRLPATESFVMLPPEIR
jgi:hypothetical protein